MSIVLRLFKNGIDSISDWQEQVNYAYDSSNRAQIKDTIKASKFYDITSIPSPFARMQLVKDAFREIVKTGNLDADDIYGRTVDLATARGIIIVRRGGKFQKILRK